VGVDPRAGEELYRGGKETEHLRHRVHRCRRSIPKGRGRIHTGGCRVPVSVLLGGVGAREGGRPRRPGEADNAASGWVEL
jgi:hypothetical protein